MFSSISLKKHFFFLFLFFFFFLETKKFYVFYAFWTQAIILCKVVQGTKLTPWPKVKGQGQISSKMVKKN